MKNIVAQNRHKITDLEIAISKLPQADAPVFHHAVPGVYMRELCIKEGTVLTGMIHKVEHMFILLSGVLEISDTGKDSETLTAPVFFKTSPGTKRAMVAITDAVMMTVHGNPDNETDVAVLEARYVTDSFEEYDKSAKALEVKR